MKASKPDPAAVEWLEGPSSPTHWERGPRPGSTHTQPLMMLKGDMKGCREERTGWCDCIVAPEYIHSLDWTTNDEILWLYEGLTPIHRPKSKWGEIRMAALERWRDEEYGPPIQPSTP